MFINIVGVTIDPKTMTMYWSDTVRQVSNLWIRGAVSLQQWYMWRWAQWHSVTCPFIILKPFERKSISRRKIFVSPNCGSSCKVQIIPIESHMKNVNSLAYDSANELLWWTDDQKNTVEVLSMMDGRFHNTIIAAERDSPSSLTIDPNHGQIYWSEGYESPRVFSSKMNLEEIEEILEGQHSNPNALFYSATTEQLHVADGTGMVPRTKR